MSRYSQAFGGAERSFVSGARALVMCGEHVICLSQQKDTLNLLRKYKLSTKNIRLLNGKLITNKILFLLIGLPAFIVQNIWVFLVAKPDIIYAHSRIDQVFWSLTKPIHKRPVFWKDPSDLAWSLRVDRQRMYGKLHIKSLENCAGIYMLSKKYARTIAKLAGKDINLPEILVAPSGVILSDYDNVDTATTDAKDKIQIVSVGRLHKAKGFDRLIKAFSTIAQDNKVGLVIVGGGEELSNLKQLAGRLGLEEKVNFTGPLPNAYEAIAKSHLFVSAALEEPWGIAIAEARILGKAIVATPTEGAQEQLRQNETGVITESFTSDSIALNLSDLIKNPSKIRRLGKNAKSRIDDVNLVNTTREILLPKFKELTK